MTKDQVITDEYAIYNSDCMEVLPTLENESIDLSIYSPPFAGLYNYSSSEKDFSNCDSKEQFLDQYDGKSNQHRKGLTHEDTSQSQHSRIF